MRSVTLTATVSLLACVLPACTAFDHDFTWMTLRVDFYHAGTAAEEHVMLDRARVESGYVYGVYPTMDWTPDGARIVFTMQGGIHAVNVVTAAVQPIPFEAPVARKIEDTIRLRMEARLTISLLVFHQ